ncbi:response regulator [Flavobacterium mesophilum]|uniref:response regulator n=1 Tax=Flavobacterium mesophilum TaxID=3143495 RepID=UPI0031E3CEC1
MPVFEDSKKIICLADNDEDDIMVLHEALLEVGEPSEIIEVRSGEQLMAQLSKLPERFPELIFLDINMPGMDGFGCLEAVSKLEGVAKRARLIVYSGENGGWAMERAFALGADFYAVKPNNYQDIKDLARIILQMDWTALGTERRIFHVT